MNDNSEKPGAQTPWADINLLLKPNERFEFIRGASRGYLFAPSNPSCFSALLYIMNREKILYETEGRGSQQAKKKSGPIVVSSRALRDIVFVGNSVVGVEAGCDINTFHSVLYADGYESGLGGWILSGDKRSVGGALIEGCCSGLILRGVPLSNHLCGTEIVADDGTLLKWGGARSFSPGPALHQLLCGVKSIPGVLLKCYFTVFPVPAKRLFLAWSFFDRKELQFHVGLLQSFASSWERLDCVIPSNPHEKGFILAQISGLNEEMERFKNQCPGFGTALQEDRVSTFRDFLLRKKLTVHSFEGSDLFDLPANSLYAWHHLLTGNGFYLSTDPVLKRDLRPEPIWSERFRNSLRGSAHGS
jgi:hypothetical protein